MPHDIATRASALLLRLVLELDNKTIEALTGLKPRTVDLIAQRALERGFDPTGAVATHHSMAVVMARMEMIVVMVWMTRPSAKDSNVVTSGGHEIDVVKSSWEGGSSSVHGG
ncbi:hypothetical protein P885DRAFT_74642 [Corynascus similis CBS 632.67]